MQLSKNDMQLTRGLGPERGPIQSGGAIAQGWREIDAALAPVVGKRASAALYERSVQRQLAGAEAGTATLLHTVRELLAPLIGPGLTERVLQPLSASACDAQPPPKIVETGDS